VRAAEPAGAEIHVRQDKVADVAASHGQYSWPAGPPGPHHRRLKSGLVQSRERVDAGKHGGTAEVDSLQSDLSPAHIQPSAIGQSHRSAVELVRTDRKFRALPERSMVKDDSLAAQKWTKASPPTEDSGVEAGPLLEGGAGEPSPVPELGTVEACPLECGVVEEGPITEGGALEPCGLPKVGDTEVGLISEGGTVEVGPVLEVSTDEGGTLSEGHVTERGPALKG
jgi:hypothetical protein